jgi:hypothetical protein
MLDQHTASGIILVECCPTPFLLFEGNCAEAMGFAIGALAVSRRC